MHIPLVEHRISRGFLHYTDHLRNIHREPDAVAGDQQGAKAKDLRVGVLRHPVPADAGAPSGVLGASPAGRLGVRGDRVPRLRHDVVLHHGGDCYAGVFPHC